MDRGRTKMKPEEIEQITKLLKEIFDNVRQLFDAIPLEDEKGKYLRGVCQQIELLLFTISDNLSIRFDELV